MAMLNHQRVHPIHGMENLGEIIFVLGWVDSQPVMARLEDWLPFRDHVFVEGRVSSITNSLCMYMGGKNVTNMEITADTTYS